MDTSSIAQLLQPYIQLDESQLSAISKYIDLLVKWNARMNLTAIRDPQEMVERHFGESFFAARHVLAESEVKKVIDLGSGAGFPGIPFAMLAPEAEVTLIEAHQKKAAFLREVIFTLALKNAKVFNGRGEDYQQTSDVVTMRAVESFAKTLPVAASLAEPSGRIVLMIGSSQAEEAKKIEPEVEWNEPISVVKSESRVILIGKKHESGT